ncbi:DUF3417 domain-containing protein, partial [Desulfosarcina sp. OttesenSCG-928-A07]|nr:DUF3417 domain-containing protein [Desulfosarcina sp. OttesenSCG-928-A07]
MTQFQSFQVFPDIPKPLSFLGTLSHNLWWSWNQSAIELFRRIDPLLWDELGWNAIAFMARVSQARLNELASDNSYLAHLDQVKRRFTNRVHAS